MMISYQDKTWCPWHIHARCMSAVGCHRVFTQEDRQDAIKWWGGEDFPLSLFISEPHCFKPDNQTEKPDGSK